ncbi:hypothetical protein NEAUS06_0090 [Nematocida ausubeli]|nr:hypothetical protein NEAUS06_0090 [Nematocida ausubeli]
MKQRENELGDSPKEKGAQFSAPFYHRVVDNFLPQSSRQLSAAGPI